MGGLVEGFFNLLSPYFTYETIIKIKDCITWSSGGFVWLLAGVCYLAYLVARTDFKTTEFESPNILLAQVRKGDSIITYVKEKPPTFRKALKVGLALVVAHIKMSRNKHEVRITYAEYNTYKLIILILAILGIIYTVVAFAFIAHPLLNPKINPYTRQNQP